MNTKGKGGPHPNPESHGGDEQSTKRRVYIDSTSKIDIVDSLREQIKRYHEDNNTQSGKQFEKQFIATIVTAALVLIYTFFAGWQVKIARDTYTAVNRPYIGLVAIDTKIERYTDRTFIHLHGRIRNFGPIPGTDFRQTLQIYIDGIKYPLEHREPTPSNVYPTQEIFTDNTVDDPESTDVVNGKKKLRVSMQLSYRGPDGKKYEECTDNDLSGYGGNLIGFFETTVKCPK